MPKNLPQSRGPIGAGRPITLGRRTADGDPKDLVARGRKAIDQKRLWEAEEVARAALSKNPDYPPGHVLMGMVASQTGNVRFAIHMLEKGLARVGDDPKGWDCLATIYFRSARGKEAEAIWRRLVGQHPEFAEAYAGLGAVCLALNLPSEAVKQLQLAVKFAPAVAKYHHDLGRALELDGKIPEAVNTYRRAIQLAPDDAKTYGTLGVLYQHTGARKEAIDCFRKAHQLDPNSADGQFALAQAYSEDEQLVEAEAHVRRSIQLDPNAAKSRILLGTVLQQLGKFDEAKASFLSALDINPIQTGPYVGLTTLKITEEDRPIIEKMEELLAKAHLNRTGQEQIHFSLAKAHDDLKEYEAAMREYDLANDLAAQRQRDFGRTFLPDRETEFVNRMIELFDPEFFAAHRDWGNPSERPVFVVGMIRSGTTLTEQILSSHPQLTGAGELRFWVDRTPTANNTAPWTLDMDVARKLAGDYLELLDKAGPESPRITDKMPINFMSLGFIHTVFPNARIVHCRRNPVDNCLSIYMTQYKGSPEYGHVKENIVFFYRQYQKLMAHWRAVLPSDRFLEVNYEDLVADKENETRKMISFVGLPWDDACLHHEMNESSVRTPSLWQVRQPIYKTSVEKWRRYEPWLGAFAELLTESAPES